MPAPQSTPRVTVPTSARTRHLHRSCRQAWTGGETSFGRFASLVTAVPRLLAGLAVAAMTVAPLSIAAQTASTPLDIGLDVRSSLFSGRLLLNGQAFGAGGTSSFAVNLQRAGDAEDDLYLGAYLQPGYTVPLVAGTYRPQFFHQFGPASPQNYAAPLRPLIDARQPRLADIDVPGVTLTADFKLDGQAFPLQAAEVAEFYLVPDRPGERILLGRSNTPGAQAVVLPGRYDVVYEYRSGEHLPTNEHAVVARGLRLTSSRHLSIAVRSTVAETRVTLNGEPFPVDAYDHGRIVLVNPSDRDQVVIGETFGTLLPARRVIVGRYDVHYRSREPGAVTPVNPDAMVAQGISLTARQRRVDVDVRAITIAGSYLINGEVPPNSAYQYARIGLRLQGTADPLRLGDTYAQTFGPLNIVAGTYEGVYAHREGESLPMNTDAVFLPELLLQQNGSQVLDIPAVLLTLDLRLNGAAFPNSAYNYARITVVRQQAEGTAADPIVLGDTFAGPLQITLLPGRYSFVYSMREANGLVPENRHAVFLKDVDVSGPTTIVHDLRARPVRVGVTLDGTAFPDAAQGSAEILVGQTREDRVMLGLTSDPGTPATRLLLHGRYTAYYALRDAGNASLMPVNRDAVIGRFVVD